MTIRTTSPFRYDIVGSFLRPEKLKEARTRFTDGEITQEELRKVEDEIIIELIKKQEGAGLKAVTGGEFRRSWWRLDFFYGLNGVEFYVPGHGCFFHGEETRPGTVIVTGKILGTNHPFVEHFKFAQAHTSQGTEVKQTIPAPAQTLVELPRPDILPHVRKVYEDNQTLTKNIIATYHQMIDDLYGAGARTIQLDDCTRGVLVAPLPKGLAMDKGKDEKEVRRELINFYLTINNAVLANQPDDLTLNTHVCRGNYHFAWAASGGHDDVADPLFAQESVCTYHLEYGSECAGSFAPLAKVSEDKLVVLGLVTTKSGELEEHQQVTDRAYEATRHLPLDRLCLSPQCGFTSTEEGNILSEEEQWEKIASVKSIAEEVWGNN